jgi:hypothetical protein
MTEASQPPGVTAMGSRPHLLCGGTLSAVGAAVGEAATRVDQARGALSDGAASSTEIVFGAHDVVLAEVIAAQHLDQDQRLDCSRVRDAMSRLGGHIDGSAGDHVELVAVGGGAACAADDEPVFFTLRLG